MREHCPLCGQVVIVLRHVSYGKTMRIDPEPHPRGMLRVDWINQTWVGIPRPTAQDRAEGLHRPHYTTCPRRKDGDSGFPA